MNLRRRGFQIPDKIRFEEETLTNTYGKLIAEPLERGFGITIGNTLRRILLSSIEGAAVIAVKIHGILHEFSTIDGVKEDVADIIPNIKKLRFKLYSDGRKIATIKAKGPKNVTGGDIEVDASFEVLNPEQIIATLDKGAIFEAEMYVEKGKGYVPAELNKEKDLPIGMIAIDSVFTPIKKVNFTVEKTRVGKITDYDKLILEVWTDGSVTPEEAISEAASIMSEHMDLFILSEKKEAPIPEEKSSEVHSASDNPVFNSNLLKNVEELDLSIRSYNCLKSANIKTVADIVQKTEEELLKTKNFGQKSLNELKEVLRSMGLSFGMKINLNALNNFVESGAKQDATQG